MVKTVDRASLMASSFKESAIRTKADVADIFGKDDSSDDHASDTVIRGMTDSVGYSVRAADELIHQFDARNGVDFHFDAGRSKAIAN